MVSQIKLGDVAVDVVLKDIKNVHLSVHPPTGRVSISAPRRMSMGTIRVFAISRLSWIKRQQKMLRDQERETPREYVDRESHYVWGNRYLVKEIESGAPLSVQLLGSRLLLRVRDGENRRARQAAVERWYREQIREAVSPMLARWAPLVGVSVERVFVQRMKTKWGSCSPRAQTIRLNTDLARKPQECLEYIVVHEMIHLREPTHNARFLSLMDRLMPNWRSCREALNRLPVRHEEWGY